MGVLTYLIVVIISPTQLNILNYIMLYINYILIKQGKIKNKTEMAKRSCSIVQIHPEFTSIKCQDEQFWWVMCKPVFF